MLDATMQKILFLITEIPLGAYALFLGEINLQNQENGD